VDRKTRLGDWEGDTIVGTQHQGGLLTHVERKSLFTTISKLSRQQRPPRIAPRCGA
jgi:transposase, IS30 family